MGALVKYALVAACLMGAFVALTQEGGAQEDGAQGDGEENRARLDGVIDTLTQVARDPVVIAEVRRQNLRHRSLTPGDVAGMDAEWYVETASERRPTITAMMENDLSLRLARLKEESEGLFSELIIMDNRGLNVGISDPTTDYWQGDEAQFLEVFGQPGNPIYVSEVEFDASTQSFHIRVSLPILDGWRPVGVLSAGLNEAEIR